MDYTCYNGKYEVSSRDTQKSKKSKYSDNFTDLLINLRNFMFTYNIYYNDEFYKDDKTYGIIEEHTFYNCIKGFETDSVEIDNIYKYMFINIILSNQVNIKLKILCDKIDKSFFIPKVSRLKYNFYLYLKYIKIKQKDINKKYTDFNDKDYTYKYNNFYYLNMIDFYLKYELNFNEDYNNDFSYEELMEFVFLGWYLKKFGNF